MAGLRAGAEADDRGTVPVLGEIVPQRPKDVVHDVLVRRERQCLQRVEDIPGQRNLTRLDRYSPPGDILRVRPQAANRLSGGYLAGIRRHLAEVGGSLRAVASGRYIGTIYGVDISSRDIVDHIVE